MTKFKLTTFAVALLGMGMASTAALATSSNVIDDNMSRRGPGSTSGSGDTVEANCPADPSGNAWQGATAELEIKQKGEGSKVDIEVNGAAPNTLYTVWVRMKGASHGVSFGGSPITGGGATPLAPSSGLGQLVADWLGSGSPTSPNSFTTDANGEGEFEVDMDFPVIGGAYPFNRMSHPDHLLAQTKNPDANPIPTAIVNPQDNLIVAPFLIRVVSHCTDGLSHGLSPATREAWFQYP